MIKSNNNLRLVKAYRVAIYLTLEDYTYLIDKMRIEDRSLSSIVRKIIEEKRRNENEIN